MNLVIDSDILLYFLLGREQVVEKLSAIPMEKLCTTRVSSAVLLSGVFNSAKSEQLLVKIAPFLAKFHILEFDETASMVFAQQKAKLNKQGAMITDIDLMVASIALANGYTLVSNKLVEFDRIEGLTVERWLEK